MMRGRTGIFCSLILVFAKGTQAQGSRQESSSTSSTPPSSTSPSATPTTIFYFNVFPQPTTCGSSTITWVYRGSGDSLNLEVTNVGVPQDIPPPSIPSSTSTSRNLATSIIGRAIPSSLSIPSDISITIATNLTASSRTFVWNPVDVPQGWYRLSATISAPPLTQITFYVRTGTNTSCLTTISSSSSTTMTPSSTAIAKQDSTPVSDRVNGIIIGVTVGVGTLIIAVVALWLYCYRKGKSRTSSGKPANLVHRWNALSSTDSRGGFAANPTSKQYPSSRSHQHRSHPNSIANTVGIDFEDDVTGAEKVKVSTSFDDHGVALSTLPVLHHQPERMRPTRTYSASSSTSNVFIMGDQGALPVRSSGHRRPSVDSSLAYSPSSPLSPQALRNSTQYTVAPVISNSHSQSTTGTQHSSSNYQQTSSNPLFSTSISPSSPLSPPPPLSAIASQETKQMNRQSLGRKRKPVPAYDLDQEPASLPITSVLPLPFSTTTNRDSAVPELTHGSSFGPGGIEGKPLHYLIPDMPMPVNR